MGASDQPEEFLTIDLGLAKNLGEDASTQFGMVRNGGPPPVWVLELDVASPLGDGLKTERAKGALNSTIWQGTEGGYASTVTLSTATACSTAAASSLSRANAMASFMFTRSSFFVRPWLWAP